MDATTVAVDLAKNVFQLVAADGTGIFLSELV